MDWYGTDDDSTVLSTMVHSTTITVQAYTFSTIFTLSIDTDDMLSIDRSLWHVELTVYQTQQLKEDEWRHPIDCDRRTSTDQFIMVDMMNWFEHDCWDLTQSIQ
jgi:hypothetical protein